MLMNLKKPKLKGLLKESVILLDIMSGEEKSFYLEKMWNLYDRVYIRGRLTEKTRKSRVFKMDKKKAYELCSELTKIFGH